MLAFQSIRLQFCGARWTYLYARLGWLSVTGVMMCLRFDQNLSRSLNASETLPTRFSSWLDVFLRRAPDVCRPSTICLLWVFVLLHLPGGRSSTKAVHIIFVILEAKFKFIRSPQKTQHNLAYPPRIFNSTRGEDAIRKSFISYAAFLRVHFKICLNTVFKIPPLRKYSTSVWLSNLAVTLKFVALPPLPMAVMFSSLCGVRFSLMPVIE